MESVDKLADGEYQFFIFDSNKTSSLPNLKYLFGVVLKTISQSLEDGPPVDALYKYFEALYAPRRVCKIRGEEYEYFDLKNEKSTELNGVIEKIIQHAKVEWGIDVVTKTELKSLESAKELVAGAYAEDWKILSNINNNTK